MKRRNLRVILSMRFTLLVLAAIALAGVASNILIGSQFEDYVEEQQKLKADGIAQNISSQYNAASGDWNADYIHGMGMYALNDGYIIKLQDRDGHVVWDAENHDMSLCHEVMQSISVLMRRERPDLQGSFMTHRYDMTQAGVATGYLDISYYSPYRMKEDDFQFLAALNRILLAVGGISLAAAVLTGIFLANHLTEPLTEMAAATRKISNGDYAVRLGEGVYAREIYELTQAVNHMASALEEQEVLRKRLTSDIAHELRTPVANLSSYMEMMMEGVLKPTSERLKNCDGELRRLSSLISELERLHQIENENMVLQKTGVDLLKLAEEVMASFESRFREKDLCGQLEGVPSVVPADLGRIHQVVANLVSNAVKYSNQGGRVRIVIEDAQDYGIIRVEDDGIGISQDDLPHIFERFYRADRSRTRKTGGVGIGLTIARAIVRAHGGRITAKSEEGKGSSFLVALPKGS